MIIYEQYPLNREVVMCYCYHYETPLGKVTLMSDGLTLDGLRFDGQKHVSLGTTDGYGLKRLAIFDKTIEWLDTYFSGREPGFAPALGMKTTPFRRAVWELLLTVPYGKTTTYGELADRIARQMGLAAMSAQAVGGAVGHNSIALIIPCHRVIGADGSLTGYVGGLDRKRRLLEMEGVCL